MTNEEVRWIKIRFIDTGHAENQPGRPEPELSVACGPNERIFSIETITDRFGHVNVRVWIVGVVDRDA